MTKSFIHSMYNWNLPLNIQHVTPREAFPSAILFWYIRCALKTARTLCHTSIYYYVPSQRVDRSTIHCLKSWKALALFQPVIYINKQDQVARASVSGELWQSNQLLYPCVSKRKCVQYPKNSPNRLNLVQNAHALTPNPKPPQRVFRENFNIQSIYSRHIANKSQSRRGLPQEPRKSISTYLFF